MPANTKILTILPGGHNRMLPPAWRWELAAWLLTQGNNATKKARQNRKDVWVAEAGRLQRDLAKCETQDDWEQLRRGHGAAYEAWYNYQNDDQRVKWTIEAYLCADADFKHIAERSGESVESIACYAKLFFDVAGKQKYRLYMLTKVLAPAVYAGLSGRQPDLLWKLFGMLKGPLMVDLLTAREGQPSRMASYDQYGVMFDDFVKFNAKYNAAVCARTVVPNDYNQEVIYNLYSKLLDIEQATGGSSGGHTLIVESISKMVGGFGFTVASEEAPVDEQHWLANGVELRASDLVQRALGNQAAAPKMLPHFPVETAAKPQTA
jgi:hypothetical protein